MKGIKTENIKISDISPTATLSMIFNQAKKVLRQKKYIPLRMILLNIKGREAHLLVSFIYDNQNKK